MTALSAYKYIYHIHTCMCPQGSEAWGVAAPHSLVLELQRVVNCHVNTGIQIHVLSRANSALTCWFISPAFCPLHGNLNNHFPRNKKKKKNSWNSYGAMVWMWLSLLGSCLGGGVEPAGRRDWLTDVKSSEDIWKALLSSASHSQHSCCSRTLTGERQFTLWGDRNLLTTQRIGLILKILANANNSIIKQYLMTLT